MFVQRYDLRHLLWRCKTKGGGFEEALAELQEEYNIRKDGHTKCLLDALYAGIVGTFNYMDQAFEHTTFEPQTPPRAHSIRNFLGKFDVIFTLNQDLLLERHYSAGDGAIASEGAGTDGICQADP
jgi:hypothetical protein